MILILMKKTRFITLKIGDIYRNSSVVRSNPVIPSPLLILYKMLAKHTKSPGTPNLLESPLLQRLCARANADWEP